MFTQLSRENGGGELVAVKPIATVLRDYQLHGGYTPGPLYAFVLAAGLTGSLPGLVRRRTPSHRKHTDWEHSHRSTPTGSTATGSTAAGSTAPRTRSWPVPACW